MIIGCIINVINVVVPIVLMNKASTAPMVGSGVDSNAARKGEPTIVEVVRGR